MIKEVLQQLEPLDAQIDALSGSADDGEMTDSTAHAAELAELSAQEDMLLQRCTALTPEDRVFLARRPDRPHIDEIIDNLFTDFLSNAATGNAKRMPPFSAVSHGSTGCRSQCWGTARDSLEENLRCNFGMPGARRATARPYAS